jgi:hypothetical protein
MVPGASVNHLVEIYRAETSENKLLTRSCTTQKPKLSSNDPHTTSTSPIDLLSVGVE